MHLVLIISSLIVLVSIISIKALYRFGVPSLLIFLGLGMIMHFFGVTDAYFDNYEAASDIFTLAIVIIIFFGGFGTKWDTAKPIAVKAGLLSSFGTVITAIVLGAFCMAILKVPYIYGLLFGSVVASTDAASVFSVLRSRKLNLKHGLAPLLEIESGSNDPFAYMMTILVISIIKMDDESAWTFVGMFALQIGVAVGIGVAIAFIVVRILKHLELKMDGLYPVLLLAIVILCFSVSTILGGNGLLCVYILGIIIGNSKILHKKRLVHFFDGLSWLVQILLFFSLGLLSSPTKLISVIIPGTVLSLLLIFIARPVCIINILGWFKVPFKHQAFTAWVGFRGAASIVFAMIAVAAIGNDNLPYDLFHLVFFVALFSILIQGTLTPWIATKLKLVATDEDDQNNVLKTFTDYFGEKTTKLFEHTITDKDGLAGKCIVDANIPENILIIMIKRGGETIMPKGSTEFAEGDVLVVSGDDLSFFSELEQVAEI